MAGALQVVAISLLSNCMLVAAVRNATLPLLQQDSYPLAGLTQLLSSCNPSTSVKVYGNLSNMCNHMGLRAQLAACQPLMQQLLQAAAAATAQQIPAQGPKFALAALGCLCNMSLEQGVQQMLAGEGALTGQLLQLAAAGPAQFVRVDSKSSSSTRSACQQSSAGPKLPLRGKGKGAAQAAAAVEASEAATEDTCLLSARAATLLSRIARQAQGVQQLQQSDVLSLFAGGISDCLTALQETAAAQAQPARQTEQQGAQTGKAAEAVREWLSAAVRTLALTTAAPEACSSCSTDTAAAAITASCCRTLWLTMQ